jgi:hypothetical protein
MGETVMIVPTAPWRPGDEPTHVEYEAFTPGPGAQPERVIAALGEAAQIDQDPPFRLRYRYVWNGVPGAWNDEGVTWEKPRGA